MANRLLHICIARPGTAAWGRVRRWAACLLLAGSWLVLPSGGCGVNATDIALQTGGASANTVLDLLLTTFANQIADAFDSGPASGS